MDVTIYNAKLQKFDKMPEATWRIVEKSMREQDGWELWEEQRVIPDPIPEPEEIIEIKNPIIKPVEKQPRQYKKRK